MTKRRSIILFLLLLVVLFIVSVATSSNRLEEKKLEEADILPTNKKVLENPVKEVLETTVKIEDEGRTESNKKLAPDEVDKYKMTASLVSNYHWLNGGKDGSVISIKNGQFIISHVEEKESRILANANEIVYDGKPIEYNDWKVSHDLKILLLRGDYEIGWRHSFFAKYWIYDVDTKKTKPLDSKKSNKPDNFFDKGQGKTSLTVFSPTGHKIAFVKDNDLYVYYEDHEYQITTDGSPNILNGLSDWVYEEEVFASSKSVWFSEDGNSLAFLKFDDTLVHEYEIQYYHKGEKDLQYPEHVKLKYPKAGTPNPVVDLYISWFDQKFQALKINLENVFADNDRIFTEVTWIDSISLLVRVMNRVQDHQKLYLVYKYEDKWHSKLLRDEFTTDGAWYLYLQPLTLNPTGGYFELMTNAAGYVHIARFDNITDSKPASWVTSGNWEVTKIHGSADGKIFYDSTERGSAASQLFEIYSDGSNKKSMINNMENGNTNQYDGYFNAKFSPGFGYFELAYLGPDVPWQGLRKRSMNPWEFINDFYQWEAEKELWTKYKSPTFEYLTIKNENGDDMNSKMILPANFIRDGSKKYPVMMKVYGGPGSQLASKVFTIDFMYRLACRDIIVLIVDGRGTGYKGRKFLTSISKDIGRLEVEDQLAAARWVGEQKFVDKAHIGIWGWSYGGFVTAKIIEADSKLFQFGISVAPVTNWMYYDSIYTERYLKTPEINPKGYKESNVEKMIGFSNTDFLLIHGTADDNVHFQNSAELIWKLTGAGVNRYEMQAYTDSDHNIYKHGASAAIYSKIETYICRHFNIPCTNSTPK